MQESVSCIYNTLFSETNRSQAHGKVTDLFNLGGRGFSIFYYILYI